MDKVVKKVYGKSVNSGEESEWIDRQVKRDEKEIKEEDGAAIVRLNDDEFERLKKLGDMKFRN